MATYTPNYNLGKPEPSDPFANFRQLFNDNMDEIDLNMGGGGGSGGHTIIDPNGTDMTQRTGLQFTGNVSVSDDGVNDKTVVDILGGKSLILDAQIYSTEEKQVGVWTDKKPLYRKTIFNVAPNTVLMTNVDTFVNAEIKYEGLSPDDDYKGFGDGFTVYSSFTFTETGGVITYVPWSYSTDYTKKTADYITIWYTKTTDTAGSGGYQAYGFSPVIYSDVERVIGVWRDNKPLYAKVISLGGSVNINAYSWYTFGTLAEQINVVDAKGYNDVGSEMVLFLLGANCDTSNVLTFLNYRNSSITLTHIAIQYTKTSDVAGWGDYNTYGVPTVHYDTNEQVIGTWITGKPLYEITVEINSVNHNDWTDVFSLADADIKGYDSRTSYAQLNNGERVQLDWFVTTSIYNRSIVTNSGTKFRVETQGNSYSKIVATIQYTKTTD